MRLVFYIVLLSVILGFSSCGIGDELDEIEGGKFDTLTLAWDPSIAFPLGSDTLAMNENSGFPDSLFLIDPGTELPYWMGMGVVLMEALVDFDLSNLESDTALIRRILVRIPIRNHFPDQLMVQAYFLGPGPDFLEIDSLFSEGARPLAAGRPLPDCATEGRETILEAIMGEADIPPLLDARHLRLTARFDAGGIDTTLIPCYPAYHLLMEVGIMLDLSLEWW